ncbi:MAG: S9 family peptidase, partial [Chitinophagaceae bacterium]
RRRVSGYFSATGFEVSPDNKLLAYAVDTKSRREYNIYIKDLETGKLFTDVIPGTEGDPVWAADNLTLFYSAKNPVTLLSEKIMRHKLGTEVKNDLIVYEEKDPTNYIRVFKTKSDRFIMIYSGGTMSTEMLYIGAARPESAFKVFQPRMKDVLYNVDHAGDSFYIRTNLNAKNFKIMVAPESNTRVDAWKDYLPHNDKVLIQNFDVFKNFMAVSERKDGLTQLHIIDTRNGEAHFLSFGEPTYASGLGYNPGYETELLRFNYTSLTTPPSVYDYNMASRKKVLLKQQPVLGDFDPDNYESERVYAKAEDGTTIPISIVYRKGFVKNGKAPVVLYGYGSYGASMDASFSSTRLSLLDRGFAFAIAHIRGGQEMGRYWYEDGKMMKKKNTFTDFISAGEYLINNNYTSKSHMYAMGGSAGGLLMGAVVNMRPDLWNGVIAAVPFVDVVTTMSDPTIPLTTNEYDEWGNPADKDAYFYIKSYSPYDNVEKKAYPNMLITTGLHDSQVQYFEPAKWIAKLRLHNTGSSKLMMYTDMEVGHGGASGRFKSLKDRAREYAFLLALEG